MDSLRIHAQTIIDDTLKQVQPHAAVQRALEGRTFPGKCIVISTVSYTHLTLPTKA